MPSAAHQRSYNQVWGRTYLRAVCGSRFAAWRCWFGLGLRVLHPAYPPPQSPPSSRGCFSPSDSAGVPSQAQPKHCSLGKGRGCSPIAQGPGCPERNIPGPLPCCLGSTAAGSPSHHRGCKHDAPTRPLGQTPALRSSTTGNVKSSVLAGPSVFPGAPLITNKAMCAQYTRPLRPPGDAAAAEAGGDSSWRGHTAAHAGSGWGCRWVPVWKEVPDHKQSLPDRVL